MFIGQVGQKQSQPAAVANDDDEDFDFFRDLIDINNKNDGKGVSYRGENNDIYKYIKYALFKGADTKTAKTANDRKAFGNFKQWLRVSQPLLQKYGFSVSNSEPNTLTVSEISNWFSALCAMVDDLTFDTNEQNATYEKNRIELEKNSAAPMTLVFNDGKLSSEEIDTLSGDNEGYIASDACKNVIGFFRARQLENNATYKEISESVVKQGVISKDYATTLNNLKKFGFGTADAIFSNKKPSPKK